MHTRASLVYTEMNIYSEQEHNLEHDPELKTVWLWFGDYAVAPDRVGGKINK